MLSRVYQLVIKTLEGSLVETFLFSSRVKIERHLENFCDNYEINLESNFDYERDSGMLLDTTTSTPAFYFEIHKIVVR